MIFRQSIRLMVALFCVLAVPHPVQAAQIPFFSQYPAIDLNRWYISHGWTNGDHQACEWRADAISVVDKRLVLTHSDKGGSVRPYGCPEIQTKERMGYGRYEVRMRSAAGSGLNTAFFTYVGPPVGVPEHDEIDFEFLGKDPYTVEVTHWTNGQRHPAVKIPLGFDSSKEFHNYTFDWTPLEIRWYVDGKLVHRTPKNTAIPKNPGRIYLSLWSGTQIEDSWMGPFTYTGPATAEVVWVKFTPMK